MSVALFKMAKNLCFHDVLLLEDGSVVSMGLGTVLPVPNDTTHCMGVVGQSSLASWIAIAVGLLTKIPPSWWIILPILNSSK